MQESVERLRPRTIPELLDLAFSIYRQHFWLLLALSALFMVPAYLLNTVLSLMIGLTFGELISSLQRAATLDPSTLAQFNSLIALAQPLNLVQILINGIAYCWVVGTVGVGVADRLLGYQTGFRRLLAHGRKRFFSIAGSAFLVALIQLGALIPLFILLLIGLLAGVLTAIATTGAPSLAGFAIAASFACIALLVGLIPVLIIAARVVFAPYSAALEGVNFAASIGRSWQLSRGSVRRIMLFLVAITILEFGLRLALASSIIAILPLIATTLLAPIKQGMLVALYYDTRVRRESYDLDFALYRWRATAPPPPSLAGPASDPIPALADQRSQASNGNPTTSTTELPAERRPQR